MLSKNELLNIGAYYGEISLAAIYYGTNLVWRGASSCFGRGYWDNIRSWNDIDGWNG